MTDQELQQRVAEGALRGRFGLFLTGGAVLTVAGLVLFGLALTQGHADRAWQAFQVNWIFFTGITGGSLALVAVYRVANAKWAGLLVRFSQATIFFAVVSLLGAVLVFTVGYDAIYGPMAGQLHGLSPGKALWLSRGFMAGRLIGGLTILFVLGWLMVRADLVADMAMVRDRVDAARRPMYDQWTAGWDPVTGPERTHTRTRHLAPIYVVVYSIVLTLLAFDGIMALQPHWFSNLLGGHIFMGAFLGAHTLLVLLMLYGRRQLGIADLVSPKQRHDLGKMCFGFTVFWAYLMWAQFLVIWFGNMPEETGFVFARLWGPWLPVGRLVFIGMFLLPFWGLLFVSTKKSPFFLGLFSAVSLVSLWLERYLLVTPSVTPEAGPVFGGPEAGALLAFLGLFLLTYGLFARTFPMLSPRLAAITLAEERAQH